MKYRFLNRQPFLFQLYFPLHKYDFDLGNDNKFKLPFKYLGIINLFAEYIEPITAIYDKRVDDALIKKKRKNKFELVYDDFDFCLGYIHSFSMQLSTDEEVIRYFKWLIIKIKQDLTMQKIKHFFKFTNNDIVIHF